MLKYFLGLVLFAVGLASHAAGEPREWTDLTGQFKVEAELVAVRDGKVQLLKENGKQIEVPLEQLSAGDRRYLDEWTAKKKETDAAVKKLVERLGGNDVNDRLDALSELQDLGEDASAAVPALIKLLNDPNDKVIFQAARTLRHIGPAAEPAIEELFAILRNKKLYITWKLEAGKAIRAIGKPGLKKFVAALHDEHEEVRDAAARALADIEDDGRLALVAAFKDKNDSVRAAALAGLAALQPPPAGFVDDLTAALKDRTAAVRQRAAQALAGLKDESKPAVEALAAAVKDENADVRTAAVVALAKLGPEAKVALPALIEYLRHRENIFASSDVMQTIGAPAVPPLVELLRDEDAEVRQAAGLALMNISAPRKDCVPVLVGLLRSKQISDRQIAAAVLGAIGEDAKSAAPLVLAALKDDEWQVRGAAAKSLGGLGQADEKVVAGLVAALDDEFSTVADNAAQALGALGPKAKNAVEPLAAVLKKQGGPRYWAAAALGKIGPDAKSAVPALRAALKDEDDAVGRAAAKALRAIDPASAPKEEDQ